MYLEISLAFLKPLFSALIGSWSISAHDGGDVGKIKTRRKMEYDKFKSESLSELGLRRRNKGSSPYELTEDVYGAGKTG